MVDINLLPWRDEKKARQLSRLKRMLIMTIGVMIGIAAIAHNFMLFRQHQINQQIIILSQQYDAVSALIHESLDIQAMTLTTDEISMIQKDQLLIKNLFKKLEEFNTNQICFTEISSEGNNLNFYGKSRSAIDLTDFLTKKKLFNLFPEVKLEELSKQENNNSIAFRLRVIKQKTLSPMHDAALSEEIK
jgi:Tfp pilus assembly protein PilN